ncbi:MAG: germination protein YpeB [Firmicutes bacterium]|nr:germination protein YpeB [Bacillota bacterium]
MQNRHWWMIAAVLLIIGVLFWHYNQENVRAKNSLEAGYQRALFALVNHVQNLDSLLAKGQVSQDSSQGVLTLASAWHEAESARASLSQLPLGQFNFTAVQKYLAQTGDYSYSLAQKLARGAKLDQHEQETLAQLSRETANLNRDLQALVSSIQLQPSWGTKKITVGAKGEITVPAGSIAAGLKKMDSYLADEVPAIVYDGPFSEHIKQIKPRAVTGGLISLDRARQLAEDFINSHVAKNNLHYQVVSSRRVDGNIPAYSLTLRAEENQAGAEIMVDISQHGGHIIQLFNSHVPGEPSLATGSAIRIAEDFIQAIGYDDMITTGSLRHPQTLMVTQVWQQEEVVAYPDFVKVTVALDNGEILAFDARGYLTAHRKRDLPQVEFNGDEAHDKAARRLIVDRIRPAIIPLGDASERYVWEVKGRVGDQTFLIYYNTSSGAEEKILRIIETPDGTYTM